MTAVLTVCSLVRQSIGPIRSPGKFPRPFIRPSKQIRRLLASPLYKGQASFPTLLPFSVAGKFSLSVLPMPYVKFSPMTYLSRGVGWLLGERKLVYYLWQTCPTEDVSTSSVISGLKKLVCSLFNSFFLYTIHIFSGANIFMRKLFPSSPRRALFASRL